VFCSSSTVYIAPGNQLVYSLFRFLYSNRNHTEITTFIQSWVSELMTYEVAPDVNIDKICDYWHQWFAIPALRHAT